MTSTQRQEQIDLAAFFRISMRFGNTEGAEMFEYKILTKDKANEWAMSAFHAPDAHKAEKAFCEMFPENTFVAIFTPLGTMLYANPFLEDNGFETIGRSFLS